MKASNAIATFFKYFVLILVGLIMIYPLLWMISATFKDNSEIFAGIGLWIKNPTLEGYKNALNNFGGSINILQAMLNIWRLFPCAVELLHSIKVLIRCSGMIPVIPTLINM